MVQRLGKENDVRLPAAGQASRRLRRSGRAIDLLTLRHPASQLRGPRPARLGLRGRLPQKAEHSLSQRFDPIVLARRPLEGTLAENMVRYGVRRSQHRRGSRLPYRDEKDYRGAKAFSRHCAKRGHQLGILQDHTFTAASESRSAGKESRPRGGGPRTSYGRIPSTANHTTTSSSMVPKAQAEESGTPPDREKPVALMEHLVGLVSWRGQLVADPFAGGARFPARLP